MSRTHDPFRSIVVPVDGSRLAEEAIPYAFAIAERAQSKVRFVLVHPDHYPPLLIEPAKVYLKELTRRFRERLGRKLSSVILNGPAAPSLVRHCREIGADLVVMTTHGRGGIRRAWLGSVTDELIRTVHVPVLTVRAQAGAAASELLAIPDILVPLDGSPLAEAVLEPVMALARIGHAKISLVQLVQPVYLSTDPAFPFPSAYDEELTAIQREAAEQYVGKIADRLRQQGVEASAVAVVGGAIADNLLDMVRTKGVGLVALATHGRGGFRRLVLGSVADKLVRAAEVPVLVIPPTQVARRRAPKPQRIRATLAEEFAYA